MKKRAETCWAVAVVVLALVGCGRKTEEPPAPSLDQPVSTTADQPLVPITPVDPATVGSITGSVMFHGEPPPPKEIRMQGNPECNALHREPVYEESVLVQDGRLQNVFIYVKAGLEERTFATPSTPVTIDQVGCLYVPHVSGAQVNQPVLFLNSDPTLHNIHSYAQHSPGWNFGLPFQGMKQTKRIATPEVMITLKCDVHPWMVGYLGVVPHPYFAVTGTDGSFLLKDLPPGTYTIEAWHERFGTQSQEVEVVVGQTQEIAFTFQAG